MACSHPDGTTIIVPVRNGAPWLRDVLAALLSQTDDPRFEILVVDDGSEDGSCGIARDVAAADSRVRLLHAEGRGAAAAINLGIRAAAYPTVGQVDQDVIVQPGWLQALQDALKDDGVAAAQGVYVPDPKAPLLSRIMALDLALRYARLDDGLTDHVCTGTVLYRRGALVRVGAFDEQLGYGYDNDLSYRLVAAGYRLRVCTSARSVHRWRDDVRGYIAQQYGFGYGRLDLVAKHRRRVTGDAVSPPLMMAHPAVMALAMVATLVAILTVIVGLEAALPSGIAGAAVAALAIERLIAGLRAWRIFGDPASLWFPVVHLVRDVVWVCACGVWLLRRLRGRPPAPTDSMTPRSASLLGVIVRDDEPAPPPVS